MVSVYSRVTSSRRAASSALIFVIAALSPARIARSPSASSAAAFCLAASSAATAITSACACRNALGSVSVISMRACSAACWAGRVTST